MARIAATRFKTAVMVVGLSMVAVGLTVIFAFSTQSLIPAQPAIPGYWDSFDGRMVWRSGQPSQPEHFETSFPAFFPGLVLILVGLVISVIVLLSHSARV